MICKFYGTVSDVNIMLFISSAAVVMMRNKFFDWGFFRSKNFDIPVICVGNLAVGGTGKTPHTEYLIKLLRDTCQIAVLSRGYKRRTKGYVRATPKSTARTIGDEPFQMYTKFPSVTFAVDENRCHGIEKILKLKEPSIDVVLLDDAFQHRHVKAGLNILLTDYHRLFCDDTLLPAGRLREPVSGKNRAQIIIVTKCPQDIKPIDYNIIVKQLNLYPYQLLFFSSFRYGNLHPVFPNEDIGAANKEIPLSSLADTDVLLVTGIASPAPIVERLKGCAKNIDLLSFGDHHDFTHRNMQQIQERFHKLNNEKRIIITTEKDATRLVNHPNLDVTLEPSIYALPIEVEILQNQQYKFNQHIIDYVRKNTRNRSFS